MNFENNKIFFKPWVGENYENGINGKKILVLGESHHCDDDKCLDCGTTNTKHDCNSFTQKVILNYFSYKEKKYPFDRWMNTFTKFANILNGKKLSDPEQIDFWESVAFYNYVQKALTGPRISPTQDEFNNSLPAFHYLIENLKPDLIIIWGMRLWYNLPKGIFFVIENNAKNIPIHYYKKDNIKIPLKVIYHPASSKLNYNHTIEINEFINNA